jgi:RNA polymerase sigma-70 factor (ECF subfamily)
VSAREGRAAVSEGVGVDADAHLEDDVLMARYVAGDALGFERLYARYKGPVYRFFLRQMPKADAEECHQDVWLKLVGARERYRPRSEFRAYLFTIAHHTLTDRHRRVARRDATLAPEMPEEIGDPSPGPEATTVRARDAARLYRLIAELPIAQREALLLREEAGLSLAEIAHITDTAEEGVKSRLRYAMQKLRAGMSEGE